MASGRLLLLLSSIFLPAAVLGAGMQRDIPFAVVDGEALTLDAWIPEGPGPFPAVIIVHGGGWHAGDKQTYVKPLFQPLADAGFAWFSVNYRLAPKYPFPAAVDDVESAIDWVHSHAPAYKVDRRRIAIMGESAGGHLVSFIGTRSPKIAAVVSLYGVHDFVSRARVRNKLDENVAWFLGIRNMEPEGIRRMREASPMNFVRRGMPPFLMIHGTKDPGVPYGQSVEMCEAMRKLGNVCDVIPVDGAGHGVENWEREPRFHIYKKPMVEWLKKIFAGSRRNSRPLK
jgi:alpha-L-fucosidase 2